MAVSDADVLLLARLAALAVPDEDVPYLAAGFREQTAAAHEKLLPLVQPAHSLAMIDADTW